MGEGTVTAPGRARTKDFQDAITAGPDPGGPVRPETTVEGGQIQTSHRELQPEGFPEGGWRGAGETTAGLAAGEILSSGVCQYHQADSGGEGQGEGQNNIQPNTETQKPEGSTGRESEEKGEEIFREKVSESVYQRLRNLLYNL